MATKIDHIKDKIKKQLGLEITSTGVGDKAKHPMVKKQMSYEDDPWYNTTFLATCTASIAAAVGILTSVLIIKYRKRRLHKLDGATIDTEASEDYQQLCRARMHQDWTKTATATPDKGQKEANTSRIASLSKDSDNNSPSTRSSTSSW